MTKDAVNALGGKKCSFGKSSGWRQMQLNAMGGKICNKVPLGQYDVITDAIRCYGK